GGCQRLAVAAAAAVLVVVVQEAALAVADVLDAGAGPAEADAVERRDVRPTGRQPGQGERLGRGAGVRGEEKVPGELVDAAGQVVGVVRERGLAGNRVRPPAAVDGVGPGRAAGDERHAVDRRAGAVDVHRVRVRVGRR